MGRLYKRLAISIINLMKKLQALFSITCLFLLLILLILPSPASAAEIEIFPGNGPAGSNTTEAGWTDNHLAGQSFAAPSGVVKVNRIRLTDFKLGHAGGNTGGIVSVAVFAGEPTASTQVATSPEGQSSPFGYEGRTTVISPTGPMLAREERIFIGGELANDLASLCGVDQNSIEALFLRRMIINDPQRPCPRALEWTRAYQMLTDQSLRDEWSQWGVPYGSGVIFGESTFDWSSPPPNSLPTKYTGPNWTSQTVSWQGTDNSGNYLEVNLPGNSVTPGQQYFLSIQQSHLDQGRDTEEGGYWEQGRYNCDRPNEPRQIDLFGTNTSGSQVRLDNPFCGKGNVFINGINTRNAYTSGRAYFNTFYYSPPGYPPTSGYNAATGDMANLQIYGEATYNPVGNLEGGTCAAITGWTCDGDNYNASLRVDFYADGPAGAGIPLTSTQANVVREAAVGAQCGGNPNHGFSYAIPANALRDGRSHNIYAYGINIGSGTHTLLPGSPRSVTCTTTAPQLKSLQITRGTSADNTRGTYGISGLSAAQAGSGYYNSLQIAQSLENATPDNVALVGVAFTQSAGSPGTGANLQQLMDHVRNNNGFMLLSVNKTRTINGQTLNQGNYYVYYRNSTQWQPLPVTIPGVLYAEPITKLTQRIKPVFNVELYSGLGTRTWGTYGYLMNSNGNERSIPENANPTLP